MRLRVLLADDHRLILAAVKRVLSSANGVEVVAEAASGGQALALAARTNPDVALVDVSLPDMDGVECVRRLRKALPEIRILMLSALDAPEWITRAREAGADGYVHKSVAPADLLAIIEEPPAEAFPIVGLETTRRGEDELSERETAVLARVAQGLTNKQIAGELWVTEQTVKFHLRNIYRKLGTANRTQAAFVAHDRGLVARLPPVGVR